MGWFRWFMLAVVLVCPLCMLGFGLRWRRGRIPPYGNSSGYRTRRSLAGPEAWAFAHVYFGRLWSTLGAVTMILSAGLMLLCPGGDEDRIGLWGGGLCLIQCILMIVPMIPTERALARMGG